MAHHEYVMEEQRHSGCKYMLDIIFKPTSCRCSLLFEIDLAVLNSSIGDLVTHFNSRYFYFWQKKERLQGLRLRRYNLTKKYLPHFISTPIREQRLVTFETQHWLQFWKLRTWIHDNLSFLRWFVLVLVVVVEDENKVENWDCGVGSCQNAKQQTKSSYTPAPAEIEMKIEGEFLEWWWVHFWLSIGEMTSGGRSNHIKWVDGMTKVYRCRDWAEFSNTRVFLYILVDELHGHVAVSQRPVKWGGGGGGVTIKEGYFVWLNLLTGYLAPPSSHLFRQRYLCSPLCFTLVCLLLMYPQKLHLVVSNTLMESKWGRQYQNRPTTIQ